MGCGAKRRPGEAKRQKARRVPASAWPSGSSGASGCFAAGARMEARPIGRKPRCGLGAPDSGRVWTREASTSPPGLRPFAAIHPHRGAQADRFPSDRRLSAGGRAEPQTRRNGGTLPTGPLKPLRQPVRASMRQLVPELKRLPRREVKRRSERRLMRRSARVRIGAFSRCRYSISKLWRSGEPGKAGCLRIGAQPIRCTGSCRARRCVPYMRWDLTTRRRAWLPTMKEVFAL